MLVVRCYCLPENPDKLGQHVVGHCPAAESDYVVAQAGLQQVQDLIPIPYCGHIARNNNQLWFYPVSDASPDYNGATPKPIPFDNTGVGKAFSTTSTICAIESEPRLVRKKKLVSTASSEKAWAHAPSTTPYDATYVPGSEADQRMDDELEDQSHAIDFQQSSEKFVDYAYLLY